jgi:hypothetical protein
MERHHLKNLGIDGRIIKYIKFILILYNMSCSLLVHECEMWLLILIYNDVTIGEKKKVVNKMSRSMMVK